MSKEVLQVRNLHKSFSKGFWGKRVPVLEGINFDIQPGTITGFIGGNGAGKTTTIKCLLELVFPDSGEILFFGGLKASAQVRARIGFLPERPYFYEHLSGYEFLRFYGELSGKMKRGDLHRRILYLLERVNLSYAMNRALRSYSKGMLQRVGIAQALIHQPEFVIFDEPMSGLDPDGRWEVTEIIRETAKTGTAVFFSSHLLNDAEKLCDHLVILGRGQVRFEGTVDNLLSGTSPEISVHYRLRDTVFADLVPNQNSLQVKIDELRAQRAEILEVRPERMTLEQIFRKMEVESRPD
jgi:ABC-2 type transport system ATP-binding protein